MSVYLFQPELRRLHRGARIEYAHRFSSLAGCRASRISLVGQVAGVSIGHYYVWSDCSFYPAFSGLISRLFRAFWRDGSFCSRLVSSGLMVFSKTHSVSFLSHSFRGSGRLRDVIQVVSSALWS